MPDPGPDLTQAELYARWTAAEGRNKDRPAFIREYRDAFAAHVSTERPVPGADAPLKRFREWLETYKATVTRQLAPDPDTDDAEDSDA